MKRDFDTASFLKWALAIYAAVTSAGLLITLAGAGEKWGQYGDFVGGIVNPAFGVMSVYLVVQTILEQRRQSVITEVQRLMSSLSQQIEDALERRYSWGTSTDPQFAFIRIKLTSASTFRRAVHFIYEDIGHPQLRWDEQDSVISVFWLQSEDLRRLICNLGFALDSFKKYGGDTEIRDLYRMQYEEALILFMTMAEFLTAAHDLPTFKSELFSPASFGYQEPLSVRQVRIGLGGQVVAARRQAGAR